MFVSAKMKGILKLSKEKAWLFQLGFAFFQNIMFIIDHYFSSIRLPPNKNLKYGKWEIKTHQTSNLGMYATPMHQLFFIVKNCRK
jgi:hypothetical protein